MESCVEVHEDLVVTAVADAEAGLGQLAGGEVDCVVSDYEMPGLDGIGFLGRVREREPSLPFVLHTGTDPEAFAAEAFDAGVTGYVPKGGPETPGRLEAQIRATVSEFDVASGGEVCRTAIETLEDPVYVLDETAGSSTSARRSSG